MIHAIHITFINGVPAEKAARKALQLTQELDCDVTFGLNGYQMTYVRPCKALLQNDDERVQAFQDGFNRWLAFQNAQKGEC